MSLPLVPPLKALYLLCIFKCSVYQISLVDRMGLPVDDLLVNAMITESNQLKELFRGVFRT